MRGVVVRSLIVIAVGVLILIGVLYVASTVDARPPEVLGYQLTQPVPDDLDRALTTTSVEIEFSEPVEADEGAVTVQPHVDGSLSWSGSTAIFTPQQPLALETEYVLRLDPRAVRDTAGNPLEAEVPPFTFTTTGRPAVVDTVPRSGARDVALDEPIVIRFSTLMDTASVEDALTLSPAFAHELHWSGDRLEIVPARPLAPGSDFEVVIDADAADAAGVRLGDDVTLSFRTVVSGPKPEAVVPADGVDGIAPTSAIAVIFDRPIDPDSVSDEMLTITPEIAGSLAVAALPGEPEADDGAGRILVFTPSGRLPLTTTFRVELAPGVAATDGGALAEPISWSFTTGAPPTTLSNRVVFISDRAGVANVWAMNPDGSGEHQITTELTPVRDYAVSPDGSRIVAADGRRLISARADGSDRRVLTGDEFIEFDPAFAPDGRRIAFGRADARTGEGLGLWQRDVGGGGAMPIELPLDLGASRGPSPGAGDGSDGTDDANGSDRGWLRAPRYSPDGQALAFVDAGGWVGIVELPAQRLARVRFAAGGPPIWVPGEGAVLVSGTGAGAPGDGPPRVEPPVEPLDPVAAGEAEIGRLHRSGTQIELLERGSGAALAAVAADGRMLLLRDGELRLMQDDGASSRPVGALRGEIVRRATFTPGDDGALVEIVAGTGSSEDGARIELVDLETGERTLLERDGSRSRWLP